MVFGRFGPLHLQKIQASINMQKQLVIKVNFWLMSSCQIFFHSNFVEHVLPKRVQKTMDLHVLRSLETTTIVSTSFDF